MENGKIEKANRIFVPICGQCQFQEPICEHHSELGLFQPELYSDTPRHIHSRSLSTRSRAFRFHQTDSFQTPDHLISSSNLSLNHKLGLHPSEAVGTIQTADPPNPLRTQYSQIPCLYSLPCQRSRNDNFLFPLPDTLHSRLIPPFTDLPLPLLHWHIATIKSYMLNAFLASSLQFSWLGLALAALPPFSSLGRRRMPVQAR